MTQIVNQIKPALQDHSKIPQENVKILENSNKNSQRANAMEFVTMESNTNAGKIARLPEQPMSVTVFKEAIHAYASCDNYVDLSWSKNAVCKYLISQGDVNAALQVNEKDMGSNSSLSRSFLAEEIVSHYCKSGEFKKALDTAKNISYQGQNNADFSEEELYLGIIKSMSRAGVDPSPAAEVFSERIISGSQNSISQLIKYGCLEAAEVLAKQFATDGENDRDEYILYISQVAAEYFKRGNSAKANELFDLAEKRAPDLKGRHNRHMGEIALEASAFFKEAGRDSTQLEKLGREIRVARGYSAYTAEELLELGKYKEALTELEKCNNYEAVDSYANSALRIMRKDPDNRAMAEQMAKRSVDYMNYWIKTNGSSIFPAAQVLKEAGFDYLLDGIRDKLDFKNEDTRCLMQALEDAVETHKRGGDPIKDIKRALVAGREEANGSAENLVAHAILIAETQAEFKRDTRPILDFALRCARTAKDPLDRFKGLANLSCAYAELENQIRRSKADKRQKESGPLE
jgi:tetratricopeptide (TPR) repeat protein